MINMSASVIFSPEQLALIDLSPLDEVFELAGNLLDSSSTVLGGAPRDPKAKLDNLNRFLIETSARFSKATNKVPDMLTKPGPVGTFIDLLGAESAHELGLTTPALVATFALIAARYGIPDMISKYKG
jgi:hypothetical protein